MNHRWLRIPPNPPMKQFWAVSVYDIDTRNLFRNEKLKAEVSSNSMGLKKNADGSVDVFFGPNAPKESEDNWVQTQAGRFWFPYFRLYASWNPTSTSHGRCRTLRRCSDARQPDRDWFVCARRYDSQPAGAVRQLTSGCNGRR